MNKLACPVFMEMNILGDVVDVVSLSTEAHVAQTNTLADLI